LKRTARRAASALFTALVLGFMVPAATQAEDYPNRPIHMVIAFPPGGPADFVGRLLADHMKNTLGQSVIIENKAGAGGTVGASYVAKAPPDGYTLFLTTVGAVAITPHLRADMPYDSQKDFTPIALVVHNTTVIVVRADSPLKSVEDLVRLAKEKPGTIPIASTGYGSTAHLAIELLQSASGAKFIHVPYRGAAPALTDLLGGQAEAFIGDVPAMISQIQAGKVRAIAVAATARNPKIPDARTLAESGYPDTDVDNWYGVMAPAKTPQPIAAAVYKAVSAAVADPGVKDKLLASGTISAPDTPDALGKLLTAEFYRWGKVIRDKGLKEP
jgi:tripartite-type tricarboxylate transporter receptor subunit TctC